MKQLDLSDTVFPLRLPSTGAAKTLRCFGIMADFVFIDADHEYISVLQVPHLINPHIDICLITYQIFNLGSGNV
jgi:hypothetical protein